MKPTLEIVHVDVSHHDIASGGKQECRACPLARALTRDHKEIALFDIGAKNIWVAWEGGEESFKRYDLLPEAIQFIADFDAGKDVKAGLIPLFAH